jgi:hypothetical protein
MSDQADQSYDSGPQESESNSSNQLPSTYYSTRNSFCQDINIRTSKEIDDILSLNFIATNGNQMMSNETEETILDGSCDKLGESFNKRCSLVIQI